MSSEKGESEKKYKPDHRREEFIEFVDDFVKETDRAAVILGAAKIESVLGHILDKFLLPCSGSADDLLEGDSPLSTFSSRIKMCHRLGLIDDKATKMLHIFRKLRNGFAHEVSASSLSSGAARDRVISMAEPMAKSEGFIFVRGMVAKELGRIEDETGVIFRSFLVVMYIYLKKVLDQLEPIKKMEVLSSNAADQPKEA